MKKVFFIFAFALFAQLCFATETAKGLLDSMAQKIRAMERYEVFFDLGHLNLSGSYIVDDERFMLSIAGQQIYGDAVLRHTVDHNNKEIIIEKVPEQMPLIITNPANGLLDLSVIFDAKITEQTSDAFTLELQSKDEKILIKSSTLVLDTETLMPRSISYFAGESVIEVVFRSISSENVQPLMEVEKLPRPQGYDVIDLR